MKRQFLEDYTSPEVEMQELIVERGYGNSTFGIGTEEVGDLEELV